MIKIIDIINETFVSGNEVLAVLFADTKAEVGTSTISNLPKGKHLAAGSKIEVADGSKGYLKSDGTWGWVSTSGGGGTSDLPSVTSDDNNKVLTVVDGVWNKAEVSKSDLLTLYYFTINAVNTNSATAIEPDSNNIINPDGTNGNFASVPVTGVNIVLEDPFEVYDVIIYFIPDESFAGITVNGQTPVTTNPGVGDTYITGDEIIPGDRVLYGAILTAGEEYNTITVKRMSY